MTKPMLAHKFDDSRVDWSQPVYIQPKLDGVRCLFTKDGAYSRTGKQFKNLAHIELALIPFFKKQPDVVLDGELYNHKLKNDFENLQPLKELYEELEGTSAICSEGDVPIDDPEDIVRDYKNCQGAIQNVNEILRNRNEKLENYMKGLNADIPARKSLEKSGSYYTPDEIEHLVHQYIKQKVAENREDEIPKSLRKVPDYSDAIEARQLRLEERERALKEREELLKKANQNILKEREDFRKDSLKELEDAPREIYDEWGKDIDKIVKQDEISKERKIGRAHV